MWKAIVWSLIGLPLGVMFGVRMGPGAGVLVATVATAAAGAVTWKRACRTACDGCPVVCKTPKRARLPGAVVTAMGLAAAVAVLWGVLGLAAPFLLPLEAVALGSAWAVRCGLLRLSPRMERTGRLSLVTQNAASAVARQTLVLAHRNAGHAGELAACRECRPAPRQTALPAGSSLRAIEAPREPVEGVIIDVTERTGHVL